MSDIVERLREASLNHDVLRFGWLAEAIDEIERLREALKTAEEERDRYLTVAGRLSGWLPMPEMGI